MWLNDCLNCLMRLKTYGGNMTRKEYIENTYTTRESRVYAIAVNCASGGQNLDEWLSEPVTSEDKTTIDDAALDN